MIRSLFLIWLRWAVWVTLFSIVTAAVFSGGVTLYFYIAKGAVELNGDIMNALFDIGLFWFAIFWSITLPVSTFFGMKQLFKGCKNGYRLQLFSCNNELIELVRYENLPKVWRKWLFLMIWGIAIQLIVIVVFLYLVGTDEALMEWFNIYYLYAFVMFSSWVALSVIVKKCKLIEIERC